MKSLRILFLLLAVFCYTQGDTKILREVSILGDDFYRQETFFLKNENSPAEELVIEGSISQSIHLKDNTDFVYHIDTIYVADKDGYRVKYKLIREPYKPTVLHLNPSTLKSLAG